MEPPENVFPQIQRRSMFSTCFVDIGMKIIITLKHQQVIQTEVQDDSKNMPPLFFCCISFNLLLHFLSLTWCSSSLLLWRRQWHPTPVLLLEKSHGRSLVGCSPWGRLELDTTERLHFHFSLSCIGERNGNPLQCSCLENPRDGGAWWAAVSGVAQSWTRLKRLSSSSSKVCGPFGIYINTETEKYKHTQK